MKIYIFQGYDDDPIDNCIVYSSCEKAIEAYPYYQWTKLHRGAVAIFNRHRIVRIIEKEVL